MSPIELLNARLAERLGYKFGQPRFAWKFAPELHYFWRPDYLTGYVRQCWADQIGKVWVLAQVRRPEMSREQWWEQFHGQFPYPERGAMYYAHAETALRPGMEPDGAITAAHIRALEVQIEKSEAQHLRECTDAANRSQQASEDEWMEYCADFNPAFDNWHSGTKNGVEFQVPGLKKDSLVSL